MIAYLALALAILALLAGAWHAAMADTAHGGQAHAGTRSPFALPIGHT